MKQKIMIGALAFLLGSGLTFAQSGTSLVLNMQEALDYAMEHNKSLQNSRAELVKAEKSIWEAISSGLPQADFAVDYLTYFGYELEFSFGGDFDPTSQEFIDASAVAMATTLNDYPGVTETDLYKYFAGTSYENTLNDELGGGTILMSDQLTAAAQVSQLIFSGQYIVGIQTAKLAKEIAKKALDNSEVGTKEAVINAYYLTLITERSLDFVEANLENLESMLMQTEKMADIGMAEELDVDQFQVNVNQLDNAKRSMERNLQLNYNMLRMTLGIDAGTEIELTDELDDLFSEMEALDLLLRDFNKEDNLAYQMMNTQTEINKKLWDLEKWNFGPTLAGFYKYNFKLLTTGFDMTPNHMAGFSFSLPILSSGQRLAKTQQARIQYEISERETEIIGDQLELQNDQLKYNLESSIENYNTQKENVDVARRVLANYQRKFENGMASSLDVTQANSSLLDVQSSYLSAMFEVMNARIQLEKLMNNLNDL